jgi:hypothetical protein
LQVINHFGEMGEEVMDGEESTLACMYEEIKSKIVNLEVNNILKLIYNRYNI